MERPQAKSKKKSFSESQCYIFANALQYFCEHTSLPIRDTRLSCINIGDQVVPLYLEENGTQ